VVVEDRAEVSILIMVQGEEVVDIFVVVHNQ
jgi:hypothetical protein